MRLEKARLRVNAERMMLFAGQAKLRLDFSAILSRKGRFCSPVRSTQCVPPRTFAIMP